MAAVAFVSPSSRAQPFNFEELCYTPPKATRELQRPCLMHTGEVHEYGYVTAVRGGSASTTPYRLYINFAVRRDYSSPAARALCRLRRAPRLLVSGRTHSTSTSPCAATTRLRPHALYVNLAVSTATSPTARALRQPRRVPRLLVSGRTLSTLTLSCTASTRLHSPGCSDLLRLRRASGCLGMSRGSSRGLSRHSSSTTPPRAGSSSTTSSPPRIRVPRHVTRLVTRLVAPLIVDYSSSTTSPSSRVRVPRHVARLVLRIVARLVVDYFACAARSGALARRAARRAARHTAHRRLLRAPRLRLAATLALLQPHRAW
jgi:hypothetical protein